MTDNDTYDNRELIKYFVDKINAGEITFDQVRKELETKALNEPIIKVIVRLVDDEVRDSLISGDKKSTFDQYLLVGIVATAVGIVLTAGSFAGLFTSGNTYLIVVAYGPLLGGLALIFAGLRRKRRKHLGGFGSRHTSRIRNDRTK